MDKKKTLVIGASEKTNRYANKAVRMLQEHQVPVVAFGNRKGNINGTEITTTFPHESDIHTVTLYLSAKNQNDFYDKILSLEPKRVIFNPGTENPSFEHQLEENGIQAEIACTLVLLSTNTY
ncbi:CoA-binding protein [Brumimicrobium salinarum]|uniref:CoA-binding protein n=1 Tax=Brumimicrobium salinarum TaxID=2058658 RepID=A0A2I0R2X0_9FLAO|nr:CoA-binding protein [Brumimicrobium salinarum]PKR80905.1 CoA-binding protein [Brumimicrobium salinarum]